MAALSLLIWLIPALALAQDYKTSDCPPPVAYQDGVDANGWAVAPADLNPPAATPGSATLNLKLPATNYTDNPVLHNTAPFAEIDMGDMVIPLQPEDSSASDCQ